MSPTQRKAMEQVLIAAAALLSDFVEDGKPMIRKEARDVLERMRKARAALAEPAEQEPVALPHVWPHVWGCRANAFGECDKGCTAPQPAAVPAEYAIEAAYWDFDARHKGYGPHKTMPQSERDAFKWAVRAMLAAAPEAPQPKPSGPETMTVQEVWEAAGGNPGIRATKQGVLDALKMLDAVCDEAQPAEQEPVAPQQQQQQLKRTTHPLDVPLEVFWPI